MAKLFLSHASSRSHLLEHPKRSL